MKCYFLRRTEEWECILENTDHPKVLCPDKMKVIMNLFASRWESKTLNFSNKSTGYIYTMVLISFVSFAGEKPGQDLEHNSNKMLVFL